MGNLERVMAAIVCVGLVIFLFYVTVDRDIMIDSYGALQEISSDVSVIHIVRNYNIEDLRVNENGHLVVPKIMKEVE